MNSELHVYEPPERAVKNAWVSGMDAYRRLVAEAEHDHGSENRVVHDAGDEFEARFGHGLDQDRR